MRATKGISFYKDKSKEKLDNIIDMNQMKNRPPTP